MHTSLYSVYEEQERFAGTRIGGPLFKQTDLVGSGELQQGSESLPIYRVCTIHTRWRALL
jgi:hypothetical protein